MKFEDNRTHAASIARKYFAWHDGLAMDLADDIEKALDEKDKEAGECEEADSFDVTADDFGVFIKLARERKARRETKP